MVITLSSDLENALTSEASRQGTTAESLALDCLRSRFLHDRRTAATAAGSLLDLLADRIGIISSADHVPGGARMSESTGKKFMDVLLQKKQQGRL